MIEKIKKFIEDYSLLPLNSSVIVGLSGGPDSVFLLHFLTMQLKEKNLHIIAAHLDHQWRQDSTQDELFCRELCQKLDIPFISAQASELKLDLTKGSLEEQGRLMRRFFFERVKKEQNADLIALAHHADDQEETFFIRLIRGTTLSGLSGIRPKNGPYIRPLLPIFKREIISYLETHEIEYLIDPSNEKPEFLRNRIRQTVIPALRTCDDRFDKNFLSTLHSLQEAEDTLTVLSMLVFEDIAQRRTAHIQENNTPEKRIPTNEEKDQGLWTIDITKLLSLSSYLRNRIILHWLIVENVPFTPSEQFFEEITRFLQQPGSKDHQLHSTWGIRKKKNSAWLYLLPES